MLPNVTWKCKMYVYRTYVTGAYMSTCRYINTCQMNVDLYVLRYECIQMYNVWCASDGSVIWFEESKKINNNN